MQTKTYPLFKELTETTMTQASSIRDYFSDPKVVSELIYELNVEIGFCPILRNLNREKKYNVIEDKPITFRQLGTEDRNEVFVYLGRILESVITCQLAKGGFDVKKDRSSSGDLTVSSKIWEIKGTSGDNSWTGSTHASKKEDQKMDFIGVKYGLNEDINVFDIFTGEAKLLDEIFIGVFESIELIRMGKETANNSRTQLLIGVDSYDQFKNQVAWGNLAYPAGGLYKKNGERKKNVKYLQLETA